MCVHGFMDTWRTWELVLPALERSHDVLAPTLPGHAGGPPLAGWTGLSPCADAVAAAMDAAGFQSAHIVGNSLGGHVALELAARGRALSVVAFAPAGGWEPGDEGLAETLELQARLYAEMIVAAPQAPALLAGAEGRRRATRLITESYEHIPVELLAHQLLGAAICEAGPLIELALRSGFPLEPELIRCPVRIVWGTCDRLLPWPSAAARLRRELPNADWVELEGVGHCPQLDVPLEAAQLILGFTN